MILQQEIGLKCTIDDGLGHLGLSSIYRLQNFPSSKKFLDRITVTIDPVINQVALQNSVVYPSGPGALFGGNFIILS